MTKSPIKSSRGMGIFRCCNAFFLTLLGLLSLYPIIYVVVASISDGASLMKHTGLLLYPQGKVTLQAYRSVLSNPNILSGYYNTFYILIFGVTLQITLTSLGAYFFSRRHVMWRNLFMFMIVFTMFFEGGMIPFYLTVKGLHLANTRWSLILPFLVNAYNLIIMRTYFAAIPISLEESARIDGATHMTILQRIILPLSKPVIAVMILYYGVSLWNGWFWASVFVGTKRKLYPLQLILREILVANDINAMTQDVVATADQVAIADTIKYATVIVATVPILCIYPFLQKYFASGVMIGAIKG